MGKKLISNKSVSSKLNEQIMVLTYLVQDSYGGWLAMTWTAYMINELVIMELKLNSSRNQQDRHWIMGQEFTLGLMVLI